MLPVFRDYSSHEGQELHEKAIKRMHAQEKRGVTSYSYRQAVVDTLSENRQSRVKTYADDAKAVPGLPPSFVEAYRDISNFILGIPRKANNKVDIDVATQAVNDYFNSQIIIAAATYVLEARKQARLGNLSTGNRAANESNAFAVAARELPATYAAYGSGRVTPEALREMFPSFE